MIRKAWLSSLFVWVSLGLLLQAQTCERGDTFLLSLSLVINGEERIQGFNINNRSGYSVTTTGTAGTLTVQTRMEDSTATYQWIVDGTTIEANNIGLGGGTVQVTIPEGQSRLFIGVRAAEGNADGYWVDVERTNSCESLPDGEYCDNGTGNLDVCSSGVCTSDAVTKSIAMACKGNVRSNWFPATWTLSVDPSGPVVAGQPFDVDISGSVDLETEVEGLSAFAGVLSRRVAVLGTVNVRARSGAAGIVDAPVADMGPWVCGRSGNACDPAKNAGGTLSINADCLPVGGDYCLRWVDQTTIDSTTDACGACSSVSLAAELVCELTSAGGGQYGYCMSYGPPTGWAVAATMTADAGATEVLLGFEETDDPLASNAPFPIADDGIGFDVPLSVDLIALDPLEPPGSPSQTLLSRVDCYMGEVVVANPAAAWPSGSTFTPLPDSALISIPVRPAPTFPCIEQGILDAIAAGGGPHTFDCAGPTTINTTAEILIDNDVILDFEGEVTLDAGGVGRLVRIPSGVTAELRGVTLTNGVADGAPSFGDAVLNEGDLTLRNVVVTSNGLVGQSSLGAIVSATVTNPSEDSPASLRLVDSVVSDNQSLALTNIPSGVFWAGSAEVLRSEIRSNGMAGGTFFFVDQYPSSLTIEDSTISNTDATISSSLFIGGPIETVSMARTTVSGIFSAFVFNGDPTASSDIDVVDSTFEGGNNVGFLLSASGPSSTIALMNSTVAVGDSSAGNIAALNLGGLAPTATATVSHVTIFCLDAFALGGGGGVTTVQGSILVGGCSSFNGTNVVSLGYNRDTGSTCLFDPTDETVTPAALDLGPLQDNGGPTETILPGPGSVAIDAVPVSDCGPSTDQRGITRPQGGLCDIGAVEAE